MTKCNLEFRINSPAGCPDGYLNNNGIFFGFFGWAFVLFMAYFIGGYYYNRKMNNLNGINAIPNLNFWK